MQELVAKAGFEAGIKLGAVFHQFIGLPISFENVEIIERAIESCVSLQPYVEEVKVEIDREVLRKCISGYGYATLSPEMLRVEVLVSVKEENLRCKVRAKLEWIEDYPLMYLKEVVLSE